MANGNGFYIPPGGLIGAQSQTQAGTAALIGRTGARGSTGSRRSSRSSKKVVRVSSSKRKSKRAGGKMRAGSAAAKAWGAKMRRLRRK